MTTTNIAGEYTGLSVKTADNSLIVNQDGLKVNIDENSGLDTTTDGLAVKLAESNSGLTATSDGLKVNTGSTLEVNNNEVNVKLAETNSGLATNGGLHIDAGNGLSTETGELAVKLDGKSLSAGENGLKVNVQNGSGLTADGNGIKINNGDTLKIENNTLDVNLASNSGLATDGGLHVNTGNGLTINGNAVAVNVADTSLIVDNAGLKVQTGAGLTTDSTGLKVNVKDDSGLKFENGALSIDKDALNMGSTNVKGSTNIDVAGDGTVSLKPDVTLDADTKDGNKIDLNGTNGTISAVNSNEKSFLGWESKATNTFDFDENGGNFESVKETTTKEYITGITLSKNIIRNTAEFNEDGATFETNKVDTGKLIDGTLPSAVSHKTEFNENGATFTKNQFDLGEDIDKILSSSSTNIDGGTITLSSGILGDKNKVVIDGTKQEVSGLSNTTWNANDAKDSTKAATEAQLYTVADALEESNGLNVKYDSENKQKVTLGGENSAPVELKNVKAGELGQNSTDAVNGSQLFKTNEQVSSLETTVNNGWTATDGKGGTVNVTPKDGENTLQFNGDKNIDVTAADGAVNVGLKPVVTLGGDTAGSNKVVLDGNNGSINAVNTTKKGQGKGSPTITNTFSFDENGVNLTNTKENGGGKGPGKTTTNTFSFDENGATFENTTQKDNNVEKSFTNINGGVITTDKVHTGDTTLDNNGLTIGTTTYVSSTGLNAGNKVISNVAAGEKGTDAVNVSQLNSKTGNLDYSSNKYVADNDNLTTAVGKLDDAIQKTSETANKGWTANAGNKDINVKSGDTLQFKGDNNITVSATTDIFGNNAINVGLEPVVTLDGNKLDGDSIVLNGYDGTISAVNTKEEGISFIGRKITSNKFDFDNDGAKFVTVKTKFGAAVKDGIEVHTTEFNENGATFTKTSITEDDMKLNNSSTNIDGGTITTDKVQDLDNTTWNKDIAKAVAENEDLQGMAATQGQLQTVDSKVNAGWIATDGTNKVNVNPNNNTLKFAGDDNITVTATTDKDGNNAINVKLDDDITLGNGEDAINIDGNNGTLSIGNKFAVDKDGNVSSAGNISSNGDVIADADGEEYSLSEVGKYAVRYDKANDGTSTITLADGDDLSGTRIKNVADGVDPKDAVNVSQLEAVEATANKGWIAKAGNETINVETGKTLNFNGDENITVSATTSEAGDNAINVKLNDNITLGDKTNTSLTLYTDSNYAKDKDGNFIKDEDGNFKTGYIPDSYYALDKTDPEYQKDTAFFEEHGGFLLYSTNAMGAPMFGVTTDGVVHAKDVVSYVGSDIKYSLNDVGDIVTQLAHATFTSGNNATDMEYTLISDFTGEIDKENPFVAVDENGNPTERTIGLAVREDGAVVVGAVVDGKGVMSNETGIRINDANTETGGGKDTITGLSNTDWRPAAIRDSISTFGIENDDDSKAKIEKSKAATQGQLDAMYDTVVGYDINKSKTGIDYSTITLKGTPYGSTKDGNGSHEGGTLITNVAYAVTDTASKEYNGSAAVNVDLLKDTVANVTSQPIESDRYLTGGKLDGNTLNLTVANTQQPVSITGIASTGDIDTINQTIKGINQTITEINDTIKGITTGGTGTGGNNNTDITGGRVDETGNLVLEKNDGSKVEVGQLTDSAVSDVTFDKEKGTLTITNKDNYTGKESGTPITVEGIASKDDIKTVNDTIGVTSKEDLKEKYKDADTAYITDSETMVDADIALDHAVQDLASNDQYLNSRIDSVEKRLGDVEQRIDKVGAMAAAIANLRTMGFDPEAPTEIAVGVGQYKSETGLAIGVFHYPNQDFMLSASLSTSGDEVMGGIGATWRIGRKTAAEKAKDEEKRILAKAEEIKQAAKRAEVKAQADRHAKLLAEREAKGESIRPIENKVEQTQEQA